ncbi:MAG TPA: DUF4445 domain-containing protein [Candidatus Syntrophoarchaeum butanivorans]|uniref:DUF4445 domain-containing protein n=2 Tax=Candidatus Syntropharchaeum butanivorans TaxID=1839936 RepID=A0A7C0X0Q3_9EURY|nr:DUF4445 domain-containing protein [Candidatus Syntrophoarchaeum butanivorans]
MVKEILPHRVVFLPEGKSVEVLSGTTILDAALKAGVNLGSVCGGKVRCGKCRVIIRDGAERVSKPSNEELNLLAEDEIEAGYRLACATTIGGDLEIMIPPESRGEEQRLQVEGLDYSISVNPFVTKYVVGLPVATFEDGRTDKKRLLDALEEVFGLKNLSIDYSIFKDLPKTIRKGNWTVTAVVWNKEKIISVEPGANPQMCGLALDIGTTKIAGYLIDLYSGRVLGARAIPNPQIKYGSDVITRITYTMGEQGRLERLQQLAVDGINQIIEELCEEIGVRPDNIYEMTVVGNTAMHHILLGVCPKYLAWSPYTPALGSENIKASELKIKMNKDANVYLFPVIGGFVGGDHVAAIAATRMGDSDEVAMLLDIGTNTEIALGNKEGIISCSCASGPAFEGFHIKYGIQAVRGAIEHVKIDPVTFEVKYSVIGNVRPVGLCGSALIDLLAEMLRTGVMDVSGNLNTGLNTPRIRKRKSGASFVVSWKDENGIPRNITITQQDIRELQLAKAAIRSGAEILMDRLGVCEDDIERLYIAGAFGSSIDPKNARIIGLYPEVPLKRVKIIGNAAVSGAKMALISKEERKRAEEIAEKVTYVELSTQPEFMTAYLRSNYFPYADPTRYPKVSAMLERCGVKLIGDGVQRRLIGR